MKMKSALALLAIFATNSALGGEKPRHIAGRLACSPNESWVFTPELREDFVKEFKASLSAKRQISGFANAMALRRLAQNFEQRLFGEYWVSRSLHQANLMHIAHSGFLSVASHRPTPETIGIQVAAVTCLLRIEEKYPSIGFPNQVAALLPEYLALLKGGKGISVAWEAAHASLRTQLSRQTSPKEIDRTLSLLSGSGAYEALGKAVWAAQRGNHSEAIRETQRFLDQPVIPSPLKRYVDTAHMTLARSLYSKSEFGKAAEQYKLVGRRSNELASSLSELSWAYLLGENYSEAVGTATNLQAGGLRHTFAPEAPMVMAMAMNELCQYPESVRATNLFKKLYEEPYRWLAKWNQNSKESQALYPLAVEFLKKKKKEKKLGAAPDRIASEWVRSPVFISSQEEINLIFEEQGGTSGLSKSGSQEQTRAGREAVRMMTELKPRYKAAKAKQKPGEALPKSLINELRALKAQLAYFRRLQNAAPVWRNVLANYQKQVPRTRANLVARINEDLNLRTSRMFEQLEEIAENIQLIEVEIYNGASQDIIWQNAHPDYKQVARAMKNEHEKAAAQTVWDWGRAPAMADNGEAEIWEDELGSFKADLFDNCSSKDRYLAIRMHRGK